MHGVHHLFVALRAGDGEHARVRLGDHVGLGPKTAGDDHATVFGERLADRVEAFSPRAIEEAAGIHHHEVGALVLRATAHSPRRAAW